MAGTSSHQSDSLPRAGSAELTHSHSSVSASQCLSVSMRRLTEGGRPAAYGSWRRSDRSAQHHNSSGPEHDNPRRTPRSTGLPIGSSTVLTSLCRLPKRHIQWMKAWPQRDVSQYDSHNCLERYPAAVSHDRSHHYYTVYVGWAKKGGLKGRIRGERKKT